MKQPARLERPAGTELIVALDKSQQGTEALSPTAHEELNLANNQGSASGIRSCPTRPSDETKALADTLTEACERP